MSRKTPAEWMAELPNLKRNGAQIEGPCPNPSCDADDDGFHVNLAPPHGYGCRKCEDGVAILKAVFGERRKRKANDECVDAEYETADGLRHQAYRIDWPDDWGGLPCDWPVKRGQVCLQTTAHKHLWEQKHKGRRGRPVGLLVAFWHPIEKIDDTVVLVEGPKTARAVCAVGYTSATWCGGTAGVKTADYSPLFGREVVVWPDASKVGRKAGNGAAQGAYDGGAKVRLVADEHTEGETDNDAADLDLDTRRGIVEEARGLELWQPPDAAAAASRPPDVLSTITPEAEGLRAILDHLKIEVRQNARNLEIEIRRTDWESEPGRKWRDQWESRLPSGWVSLSDKILADIRQYSKANYRFTDGTGERTRRADWSDRVFFEALLYLTPNPNPDPFVLWLETLPAWDGTPRMASFWTDTLHVPTSELCRESARRFLIGAVRRAYEPGCVHDWMPVLVGPQGLGKSSILKELLPSRAWFSDATTLDGTSKEKFETTGPAVLSEFAEMAGLERADAAKFKTYVSQQEDRFRPAYAKESVNLLRRWVGVGTANADPSGVLPADPTGSRRYVVLESGIEGKDNHLVKRAEEARRWVRNKRAQLWAEALHEYREAVGRGDEGFNLMGRFRIAAEEAASGWQRENQGMADLVEGLKDYGPASERGCGIGELMVQAGLAENEAAAAKDRATQNRLAVALSAEGWDKKRKKVAGGKQKYLWKPPVYVPRLVEPPVCVLCKEEYYPPELQEETPPGWDRSRCPGCQDGKKGGDFAAGSVSERQESLELGPTGRLAHLALVDADLQRRLSTISEARQIEADKLNSPACSSGPALLLMARLDSRRAAVEGLLAGFRTAGAAGLSGVHLEALGGISKLADRVELACASLPSDQVRALDWHQLQVEARVVVQRELDKGTNASLEGIGGLIIGSAHPPLPGMLGYSH